jgi:hypothetical protein
MGRISDEAMEKLRGFLDALPEEARSKCALCNETLVHIVKRAEVESGAGTATVTRELAARVNEGAPAGDRVTGAAFQDRVRTAERGRRPSKSEMAQCQNKPAPSPDPPKRHAVVNGEVYDGPRYADMAIEQLKRIKHEDPNRESAMLRVRQWIDAQLYPTPKPTKRKGQHQHLGDHDPFEDVSPAFAAAWDGLYREIRNTRALGWTTTTKVAAVRRVEVLRDAAAR